MVKITIFMDLYANENCTIGVIQQVENIDTIILELVIIV